MNQSQQLHVPQPDVVMVNGRIVTLDSTERVAAALVISGGRIAAVGSDEDMLTFAGLRTAIIDLEGTTVTPGLIDTHLHTAVAGLRIVGDLDLSPAKSIEDIVQLLEEYAARREPGEWITGNGWLETSLKEGRAIERLDLDRAAPNNPVILTHATGHLACANSLALKVSGITERTADPLAGKIGRSDDGITPNGILHEFSAMQLVLRFVPPPSVEMWKAAIQQGGIVLAREGVTATKETYKQLEYQAVMTAYTSLSYEGLLFHRPVVLCNVESIEELNELEKVTPSRAQEEKRSAQPSPHPGGIKLFIDGSLVARTAWMRDSYPLLPDRQKDGNGYPALSSELFKSLTQAADRHGFHIAVHAIGDQAIDTTIDAFESLHSGIRPALVHALLPSDHAIACMHNLAVSIETQPAFLHILGAGYARALDKNRLGRLLPLRRMIDAEIAVSFGSDWPTCPPSPRLGMWAACNRFSVFLAPETGTHEPDQRITVKEALRAYTIDAARAIGKEDEIGSIEPGKFADLVVWNGDVLGTPPDKLMNLGIRQTIIAGNIVFDMSDSTGDLIEHTQ